MFAPVQVNLPLPTPTKLRRMVLLSARISALRCSLSAIRRSRLEEGNERGEGWKSGRMGDPNLPTFQSSSSTPSHPSIPFHRLLSRGRYAHPSLSGQHFRCCFCRFRYSERIRCRDRDTRDDARCCTGWQGRYFRVYTTCESAVSEPLLFLFHEDSTPSSET